MKHSILTFASVTVMALSACTSTPRFSEEEYAENIEFAAKQTEYLLHEVNRPDTVFNPCTLRRDGHVAYINPYDWRSGFFPGTLWYLAELTGDEKWAPLAERFTLPLEPVKNYTSNHDVGFMMGSSFGQGRRIKAGDTAFGYGPEGNDAWKDILVQTARSLCARYVPEAGVIRSWGRIGGNPCTVIIDNMMNLELLFEASRLSGDDSFRKIAITHADNTLANHFREDGSCYHVLEYDPTNGQVISKHTNQGAADESAWSRGQAWAIYGFTMMYRYTSDKKYLDQAVRTFHFMKDHPYMPKDLIPWWDMDAPDVAEGIEERDASSAAIMASALYEMALYVSGREARTCREYADQILRSLSSEEYRSNYRDSGGFILKHSVSSRPAHSEVDVPLNYADYYFLEALKRSQTLK